MLAYILKCNLKLLLASLFDMNKSLRFLYKIIVDFVANRPNLCIHIGVNSCTPKI